MGHKMCPGPPYGIYLHGKSPSIKASQRNISRCSGFHVNILALYTLTTTLLLKSPTKVSSKGIFWHPVIIKELKWFLLYAGILVVYSSFSFVKQHSWLMVEGTPSNEWTDLSWHKLSKTELFPRYFFSLFLWLC